MEVDADVVMIRVAVEVVTLLWVMVIAVDAQQKLLGQYFVVAQYVEDEFQ